MTVKIIPAHKQSGRTEGTNSPGHYMKQFKKLTVEQKQALLKFPAYISLLATSGGEIDDEERMVAIKFAHTKAFSCQPRLAEFCRQSEQVFEENLKQLENALPKDKKLRDAAIRIELLKLEPILSRFGTIFAFDFHESMKTFREHVSKAHHTVIMDFILPIRIPGLTD